MRPLTAAFVAAGQPVLSSVRNEESIGRSRYDGLNFSYRRRMSNHFSFDGNYTLARAMSYDGGGGSFRNYPRDPRFPFSKYEFGPSANDERHHITASGIVNLPWGMEAAPILQFGSARPYTIAASGDTLGFGSGLNNRAVVVPNTGTQTFLTGSAGKTCYFAGQCHLVPYNSVRGDNYFQLDAKLAKNFRFGENMNLQIIAQAFNLTNRSNYGNDFNNRPANGVFTPTVAGFINPTSTNAARSLQGEFGARFTF